MEKKYLGIFILLIVFTGIFFVIRETNQPQNPTNLGNGIFEGEAEETEKQEPHPLSIQALRDRQFNGSDLVVENVLVKSSSYTQSIVSYQSEGLKQYALFTIPIGEKPVGGWPAIIFNHGYIPPNQYRTTERYIAYLDAFARNGYIVMKPDYRGHGDSEGTATGGYGTNSYTIDVLNALSSLKKYPDVDPNRIGMWGHSMGGHITLRVMVTTKDIKAGVIWAGVVASYPDLLNSWRRRNTTPPPGIPTGARRWREQLTEAYGTPEENPEFWNSISSTSYLADVSGPLELHHGTKDESVPIEFSKKLFDLLKENGKETAFYEYPGDDHNISQHFTTAITRSVDFFDKHLKEN
ncbi:MAG: alpha/beta fold hydrolase [bacterium]|nr:alpha/beta fold hydrolase [bacterium]